MSTYKNKESKQKSLTLYDSQLSKLGKDYSDIFLKTSFGRTHLVETGNKNGKPLLVFHGGNTSTAYNLLVHKFLLENFHIYAVDTIGHPGKSEETNLSPKNDTYGKWASEIIEALAYDKMACFGVSYGGGIIAKLMSVAPEKIDKAVLLVPAGINNAFPLSTIKMLLPLMQYKITKKEKYLRKIALFMTIKQEILDQDTLVILKDSFEHVRIKAGMPTNIDSKKAQLYEAATLVIAAEKDCFFPARKVLARAKQMFKNCLTEELKDSGHIHQLSDKIKSKIVDFLSD
ncbi:alpha/beta fold hydrolase [Streptococcus oricebi]|uniref:Alpha/beta hydrolase n=1 Tax=Streptococcus oricebi TaxID=1547447 RepID=A0ABS5B0T0_9STRE|nr:alpha/beta hydrolase [Streptococcus oricebi]MBP2622439.1 alpha/beta hydrolase [Streptococcus oricebi]